MKKKQLITALATSTLVLSTAGTAFADEVTPIDPTTPSTEVVTPDPSSGSSTNTSSALERIKLSVLTIPQIHRIQGLQQSQPSLLIQQAHLQTLQR